MSKKSIYILGLITLIAFPALAMFVLWFFSSKSPWEILEFSNMRIDFILLGLLFGILYAFFSLWLFNRPFFDNEMNQQKRLISSLNLSILDKLFLSFCAGFGEEILFRAGMQHYLGIWFTSILFIAIHGYLNPKKPRLALYGIFLIPFIIALGFAYLKFGLWAIISAHFSYDFVLFLFIKKENLKVEEFLDERIEE
ncbi:MAG: CPBP family intramembrane glutamic endopeptidase [Bacteroidota bacterium]